MAKALKDGVEVCVATPGRLMEFLASGGGSSSSSNNKGVTNLHSRCTMVVLDEADR
jgi:superfamily II DNA/RNA helicase